MLFTSIQQKAVTCPFPILRGKAFFSRPVGNLVMYCFVPECAQCVDLPPALYIFLFLLYIYFFLVFIYCWVLRVFFFFLFFFSVVFERRGKCPKCSCVFSTIVLATCLLLFAQLGLVCVKELFLPNESFC